ncbi:AraC family transcriptional regulator [Paraburkholderia acidisoli]|uniref:Helix-turn-helix domain-containing protein n=1 Tax=Paraburkholderia acidisoli TaxID=2571748 RepID=A0A7Z2GPH7_9BURK|nr:helix-turn-helix transcriptional regulator [Paraburkholderia acidisoli]QGZ65335.1 helix-turn-helix domain-containing protein [Paraburkholderia acidisoli]
MDQIEIENVNPIWRQRYTISASTQAALVEARTWEYENGFREVWHAHEEAQLVYVTRGVLRVLTPAGIWTLPPFHGIWLPPTVPHELHAIGAVNVRSAWVLPDADAALARWTSCRVLRVGQLLDALVNTLVAQQDADGNGGASRAANGAPERRSALALSLFLLELSQASPLTSGTLPLPQDRRLRSICEQLLSFPQNNDTIEIWSERVGASVRTLARLFREETGLSFGQWRQQLRLVEAVAKLALDVPVATIAADLGYQSSSAFISMFRKTLGDTPQRYLRRLENA